MQLNESGMKVLKDGLSRAHGDWIGLKLTGHAGRVFHLAKRKPFGRMESLEGIIVRQEVSA